MAAVKTLLTGLTTTGARAYRGRAFPVPVADANALLVFQGDDEIDEERSTIFVVHSDLEVNIDVFAKEATAQVDATLNKIRREVAIALGADVTIGLAFVKGMLEAGTEIPDVSDEGDRPAANLRLIWEASYQRSRSDPAN